MLPDLGTVSGTPGIDEMEAEATMGGKLKSCSNKSPWGVGGLVGAPAAHLEMWDFDLIHIYLLY